MPVCTATIMFYALPALVTIAALFVYIALAFQVGKARGKYKIDAPATQGDPAFERVYRVQMNTLEQLALFLPALWLCAIMLQAPLLASGLGVVWIVGRILYARTYYVDAKKRTAGFVLTLFPSLFLLIGALVGIARAWLVTH